MVRRQMVPMKGANGGCMRGGHGNDGGCTQSAHFFAKDTSAAYILPQGRVPLNRQRRQRSGPPIVSAPKTYGEYASWLGVKM